MFELISHCYKNCLDRCDDFGLSFCLEVITLCPPTSFPQLHVADITRYCLTQHSHQHSILRYFPWIVRPKFQATPPWDHGFIE